jgi:hypothetical protein
VRPVLESDGGRKALECFDLIQEQILSQVWWCIPEISATQEAVAGGSLARLVPWQSYLDNKVKTTTTKKKGWRQGSRVRALASKCKVLDSIPSTTEKERKEKANLVI